MFYKKVISFKRININEMLLEEIEELKFKGDDLKIIKFLRAKELKIIEPKRKRR